MKGTEVLLKGLWLTSQDLWAMALIWQITPEVFVTWVRLSELGFRVDTQSEEQCVLRFSQAEWVEYTLATNYNRPVEFSLPGLLESILSNIKELLEIREQYIENNIHYLWQTL